MHRTRCTVGTCQFKPRSIILCAEFEGNEKCFVPFAGAIAHADPGGGARKIMSPAWRGFALGDAGFATRAFSRGPLRRNMSGTCIVACAATWMCSEFRASTAWACSPGSTACSERLPTAAHLAATVFSHFGFTDASCLRNNPWNRRLNRLSYSSKALFLAGRRDIQRLSFVPSSVCGVQAMEFAL